MVERGVKRKVILSYVVNSGIQQRIKISSTPSNICDRYQKEGVEVVVYGEEGYPQALMEIDDPPVVIFYRGKLPKQDEKLLAVVGSRAASWQGIRNCQKFVRGLVKKDVVVVSGLAVGIDQEAHRTCLEMGGKAVAVVATGLERIYPASAADLSKRIIQTGGCIMTEQPLGAKVERWHFLARNRIVVGLAIGVLVVEASRFSGSTSTPNFALDQGKEVWCVKDRPLSSGLEELIEDGAIAVEGPEQMIY